MMKWFNKIWNDTVWSKVIAGFIGTGIAGIASLIVVKIIGCPTNSLEDFLNCAKTNNFHFSLWQLIIYCFFLLLLFLFIFIFASHFRKKSKQKQINSFKKELSQIHQSYILGIGTNNEREVRRALYDTNELKKRHPEKFEIEELYRKIKIDISIHYEKKYEKTLYEYERRYKETLYEYENKLYQMHNELSKVPSDNKTLYASRIFNGEFYSVTENANPDTVFELILDKEGNSASFTVFNEADKRVLRNPDFLEGCDKTISGNGQKIVTSEEGKTKNVNGKWVIVKTLKVTFE